MKKFTVFIACLALLTFVATSAFARVNWRKGRYIFKKNCRTCHVAGGSAKALSPTVKTKAQWDRFIETDKHQADPEAFKKLSDDDIKALQLFLEKFSADSPQPATCG